MCTVIPLASEVPILHGDCGARTAKEVMLKLGYVADFFAYMNPEVYFRPKVRIRQIAKAYVMTYPPNGYTRALLNGNKRRTMRMRNRFRRRACEE